MRADFYFNPNRKIIFFIFAAQSYEKNVTKINLT